MYLLLVHHGGHPKACSPEDKIPSPNNMLPLGWTTIVTQAPTRKKKALS